MNSGMLKGVYLMAAKCRSLVMSSMLCNLKFAF